MITTTVTPPRRLSALFGIGLSTFRMPINGSEGPLFPGISTGGSGEDSFRDPARRSQRLAVQRSSSPFIG
jgi:hypothetical protein